MEAVLFEMTWQWQRNRIKRGKCNAVSREKKKKMKKEISKSTAGCYPTIIIIRYKRKLMKNQDNTWVRVATDRRDSTRNWVEIMKVGGLINAINWNQRWAEILLLYTSPWSQWDCMLCSPEYLPWVRAFMLCQPQHGYWGDIHRGRNRRNPIACLMPSNSGASPVPSPYPRLSIPELSAAGRAFPSPT